jgi:ribosome-binding factor A
MAYLLRMSNRRPASGTASRGPSQRQLKVGEVLRRRLAEVLSRAEVHDPDLDRHPITVSEVRTSPDLRQATAYVMPLGGQGAEGVLAALRRNKAELRHLLVQGLALKYAPDLRFELDPVYDRIDETRRIFADPRVQADLARPDGDDVQDP